jgi:hypothetical protein
VLNFLVHISCSALAGLLCWLAYQWETVGLGLNPILAIPAAIVVIVVAAAHSAMCSNETYSDAD